MIEVDQLVRCFGQRVAVDGLTFRVRPGEVLGFLGPNGAGKSTTMRMITGYLAPTRGRVRVGGIDVVAQGTKTKAQVGYLPESAPVYAELTVNEFLRFSARIRGMSRKAAARATQETIELCFLGAVTHQTIGTLSKGYRHRTCLAQSIIHGPPVLILDEPTDGLDPNQKAEIRMLIREMGRTKAIVFSTHILEEVEAVCDRVLLIDKGRQVSTGTPAELKSRSQGAGDLIVAFSGPTVDEVRSVYADFAPAQIAGVSRVQQNGGGGTGGGVTRLRLRPRGGGADSFGIESSAMRYAAAQGWEVVELRVDAGDLADFFQTATGYRGRGASS